MRCQGHRKRRRGSRRQHWLGGAAGHQLRATVFDDVVARLIDEYRAAHNVTLRGLSRASDIKMTRLGDILRRGRPMTLGELDAIAAALGVNPREFTGQARQIVADLGSAGEA